MKATPLLKTIIIAPLLFGACANDDSTQSGHGKRAAEHHSERKESGFDRTTPPRIGMSREQVRSLYGEPKLTSSSPRGEVWNYTFDAWKFMVPYYNLAAKMKTGTVTFGPSGRVVDYQWGHSQSAVRMGL